MMAVSERLQNSLRQDAPPPQEDFAGDGVLRALEPFVRQGRLHAEGKDGKLAHLKNGPLYWLDNANSGPTIGTAGMATWRLVVEGKVAYSGLPHHGIHAAELAFEVTRALQTWLYENYPPHPRNKHTASSHHRRSSLPGCRWRTTRSPRSRQRPWWKAISG
jgi:hypothetical protein